MRKLYFRAQVEGMARVALGKRGQRPAEAAVALEAAIRKADDLREKRVGTHEAVEQVAEGVLLVFVEYAKPLYRSEHRRCVRGAYPKTSTTQPPTPRSSAVQ